MENGTSPEDLNTEDKIEENTIPKKKIPIGDVISYWALLTIAFLVPLAISKITYDSFDLAKLLTIQILIAIAIIARLIKFAKNGEFSFKRSALDLPIIAFLAANILATIFSVNPKLSFMGGYKRYEGLFTIISYGLLYWLAVNILNEKRIKTFIAAALASSSLVALYGILQHFNLNFFKIPSTPLPSSTWGNSAYLGSYLTLMVPTAIGFALSEKSIFKRLLAIFAGLSGLICIIFTYARAAWVGTFAGIIIVAFFAAKEFNILKYKKAIYALGAALLIIICIITFTQNPVKNEMSSAFNLRSGTVGTRLSLWKSSLKMVLDKPVFGFGQETLDIANPPYLSEELHKLEARVAFDRTHNETLQIATTTGLLGLAAYLWIIFMFFKENIKRLKSEEKINFWHIGLFTGCVAYLIQAQFTVSVVGLGGMFWLMAGTTMATNQGFKKTAFNLKTKKLLSYVLAGILTALLLSFLTAPTLRIYFADYNYKEGLKAEITGEKEQAVTFFEQAAELNETIDTYHAKLAGYYRTLADSAQGSDKDGYYKKSLEAYEQTLKLNPYYVPAHINKGEIYRYFADEEPALIDKAIKSYRRATEINPSVVEGYIGLGAMYLQKEDYDRAIIELNRALEVNKNNPKVYCILGIVYFKKDMEDEAIDAVLTALKLDPDNMEIENLLHEMEAAIQKGTKPSFVLR